MYKISLKIIIMLLWAMQPMFLIAQNKVMVRNSQNQLPVEAATVYFPNLKTSTITDANGVFTVQSKQKTVLTQISAVGFETFLDNISLETSEQIIHLVPSVHELQEIVISESSSRLQGENIINVEKLSLKSHEQSQGISLAEKLSTVPGLNNLSTGLGIGKPMIRGFSGNRIAVYAQGVRLENQQWGEEHGLGLDENGYEQVEIIKGASSLLYGNDALGGVLYFADERYARENTINLSLNSEYQSNTNGLRNTGGFKFSKNKWHLNLFGGYTTHQDYKDGRTETVENSRFQTADAKFTLGYTGNHFASSLKYNYLFENYGLWMKEDDTTEVKEHTDQHLRQPFSPHQHLETHLISVENTFFLKDKSRIKLDLGYVLNIRKEFEEHHHEDEHEDEHHEDEDEEGNSPALEMRLSTFSYNIRWYWAQMKERWTVTGGSQGMLQTNRNHGHERLIPDAMTVNTGIFAIADYYYSRKASLQFGLRTDYCHIAGQPFEDEDEGVNFPKFRGNYFALNFSTGVYQPFDKGFSLRMNLSSGFRTPNMYELLSNGTHEGTNRYEIGNPKLRTENCYQIDLSFNYKSKHVEVFLSPYFDYIRNYIYLSPDRQLKNNTPVYHYLQEDALLTGGETGIHFHPHPCDWLHAEISYSNIFGFQTSRDCLPLMPAQKLNAELRASFSWKKSVRMFSVFVRNQYVFAQQQTAKYETSTPDHNLLSAGFQLGFGFGKQELFVSLSVNNILGEKYYDHLSRYKSEGVLNMGRNFVVRMNLPLRFAIGK